MDPIYGLDIARMRNHDFEAIANEHRLVRLARGSGHGATEASTATLRSPRPGPARHPALHRLRPERSHLIAR